MRKQPEFREPVWPVNNISRKLSAVRVVAGASVGAASPGTWSSGHFWGHHVGLLSSKVYKHTSRLQPLALKRSLQVVLPTAALRKQ